MGKILNLESLITSNYYTVRNLSGKTCNMIYPGVLQFVHKALF